MSKEAIKHYESALHEAFPSGATGNVFKHWNRARQSIAEAAKQEQGEPVAWLDKFGNFTYSEHRGVTPLYTTPQQRTWVGLTDEEVLQIRENLQAMEGVSVLESLTKAIEAKLKEKNNEICSKG